MTGHINNEQAYEVALTRLLLKACKVMPPGRHEQWDCHVRVCTGDGCKQKVAIQTAWIREDPDRYQTLVGNVENV